MSDEESDRDKAEAQPEQKAETPIPYSKMNAYERRVAMLGTV